LVGWKKLSVWIGGGVFLGFEGEMRVAIVRWMYLRVSYVDGNGMGGLAFGGLYVLVYICG
jgi:hypothetical protein